MAKSQQPVVMDKLSSSDAALAQETLKASDGED